LLGPAGARGALLRSVKMGVEEGTEEGAPRRTIWTG
jgi:hypothetical protein